MKLACGYELNGVFVKKVIDESNFADSIMETEGDSNAVADKNETKFHCWQRLKLTEKGAVEDSIV
jgi:hypothetical protein